MRNWARMLFIFFVAAFAAAIVVQPGSAASMSAEMNMAADMDMADCQECDTDGEPMSVSSCMTACALASPAILDLWVGTAFRSPAAPEIPLQVQSAGLSEQPDPFPPRIFA